MKIIIIQTTTNDIKVAQTISDQMVKYNISPCVQIIPNILSSYINDILIQNDNEILIMIKTIPRLELDCKNIIVKYHNYKIPEIIKIKADILNEEYKDWFLSNLKKK